MPWLNKSAVPRKFYTNCQILMNKEWLPESDSGEPLSKAKQILFSRTGQHKWTSYGEVLQGLQDTLGKWMTNSQEVVTG